MIEIFFGVLTGVTFQVKRVDLEDGNLLYAMWLSRDPREPGEGGRSFANLTLASSLNSTMETASFSLGEVRMKTIGLYNICIMFGVRG